MPLYCFRSRDGVHDNVELDVELPGVDVARAEAVRFAAEIMRDDPAALCESGQLRVEVVDVEGALLFSVIALAIETPAVAVGAVPVLGGT